MWIERVPSKKNKKGYLYQVSFRYTDIYGRQRKHKNLDSRPRRKQHNMPKRRKRNLKKLVDL